MELITDSLQSFESQTGSEVNCVPSSKVIYPKHKWFHMKKQTFSLAALSILAVLLQPTTNPPISPPLILDVFGICFNKINKNLRKLIKMFAF